MYGDRLSAGREGNCAARLHSFVIIAAAVNTTRLKPSGIRYGDFVELALALPGVEESTSYGTHALKVKGKLMARLKEDGVTVVLRSTWETHEERMAIYPEVFFLTDHYRAHPWVLMRLETVSLQVAQAGALHAWQQVAPAPKAMKRPRSARGSA